MNDLRDLLNYLAWLRSCEHLGHVPAQSWASGYAEEEPPTTCPVLCMRCGAVLESAE